MLLNKRENNKSRTSIAKTRAVEVIVKPPTKATSRSTIPFFMRWAAIFVASLNDGNWNWYGINDTQIDLTSKNLPFNVVEIVLAEFSSENEADFLGQESFVLK